MNLRELELGSATRPKSTEGGQYHIAAKRGQVGRYVMVPGDPDRVPKLAQFWDEAHEVSSHREYRIWTGRIGRARVSACSTGIGAPAMAIAVEELARIGADTFIRVGSCGSLTSSLKLGDLAISPAAVRLDGTSRQYVQPEYPAAASIDVTLALVAAAKQLGKKYAIGYTASTDSFYVGQGRPGFGGYLPREAARFAETLRSQRVMTVSMEDATLFTLAGLYGLRCGSVLAVYADRARDKFGPSGEDGACMVAAEAVRIMSEWDAGRGSWIPETVSAKGGKRTVE